MANDRYERYEQFLNTIIQTSKYIGSGLATIGLCGAGIGIGLIFGAYLLAAARNEGMKKELFSYAILGFALCEAMGLFALMMAFLILFM